MAVVRIRSAGARQILRSPEVLADLVRRADNIRQATGNPDEYETEPFVGRNRARAIVQTATVDAILAESDSKPLLRALDAGRQ